MTRDRWVWLIAVVATWGAASQARVVAQALRDAGELETAVLLAGLTVAGALGAALLRAPPPRVRPGLPVIGLTLICAVALLTRWTLPEERVHVVLYAALGFLAWRAVGDRPGRSALALGLTALAGLGDEGVQALLPDRRFDWMDVVANAVGGAIAPLLLAGRWAWAAPAMLGALALGFGPLQAAIGHTPTPGAPLAAPDRPRSATPYAGYHVVLVTVDALRADHVPPVGGGQVATPTFAAFAARSRAFGQAWAAASWTSPSMVTLLSGLHPAAHGVGARGLDIAPELDLPLDSLRRGGWSVVGHAGDRTENFRNLGIPIELDRDDEAAAVGAALAASTSPVFAWVHLRDVHAPYEATPARLAGLGLPTNLPDAPILQRARTGVTVPRADFPGRHDWLRPAIAALYAAEVADADASFARLLAAIEASGHGARTIVILTADHGEELLEADGIGHASTTLDSVPRPELQRIPLLVRWPDGFAAGTVSEATLRQQDLLPSLLPLLGVEAVSLSADPWLAGVDRSSDLLGLDEPLDPLPNWFVTSPCGWQCQAARRAERVAAVVEDDDWTWCRYDELERFDPKVPGAACAPALAAPLAAARAFSESVGTPVSQSLPL